MSLVFSIFKIIKLSKARPRTKVQSTFICGWRGYVSRQFYLYSGSNVCFFSILAYFFTHLFLLSVYWGRTIWSLPLQYMTNHPQVNWNNTKLLSLIMEHTSFIVSLTFLVSPRGAGSWYLSSSSKWWWQWSVLLSTSILKLHVILGAVQAKLGLLLRIYSWEKLSWLNANFFNPFLCSFKKFKLAYHGLLSDIW
jgi:hypothetical protein